MSQENVRVLRGVRYPISLPSERASQRRSVEERIFLRFPAAYHLLAKRVMRLPPGSRLRRLWLTSGSGRQMAAANRRDFDVLFLGVDPEIEYRAVQGALDDRGPIHGKDALRAYMQDWIDTFDDFKVEPVELIDVCGDKVIAVLRNTGRAKLSGIETDLTYATLCTIRDGKVVRGREYWTKEQALEAAGLSK
jgi:ketosteroid isomerase-like protein